MTEDTLDGVAESAKLATSDDDQAPIALTEAALEALLFVAERPLSRREIAAMAGTDRTTVDERLGDLEVSLRDRGVRLLVDGDRVELATAPEGGALVARYVGADAVRLSPASLETMAIVAYRQPVTRAAIDRIRGVDSDYTVRTLLHRRLIVELGRSSAPGRPFLYGTGFDFLERFGLTSLEELPPLDVDVAARLAEEGGEPMTEPLFDTAAAADAAVPTPRPPVTPTRESLEIEASEASEASDPPEPAPTDARSSA
jgi:segregation and condensation protein B